MSKEDVVKVQTLMLRVNIHCDGCEKKVKKTLHKIDGVSSIDAEGGTGEGDGVGHHHQEAQQGRRSCAASSLACPPQLLGGNMPAFTPAVPLKDAKSVKFALPEDNFGDDGSEFDDDFDDDDDYNDDFYDEPKMMMKPMATGGGGKKGGKKGGGGNEIPTQSKGNGQGHNGGAKGGFPGRLRSPGSFVMLPKVRGDQHRHG
ncbi:heavy metal-associated isoprenylated plant protein 32 [Sorghum bicolor]|uniref:HMA domain-containing protein n=1 Tax=Sorghum bicolor TaxID=4558 RepID=A0A194YNY8_SORBI|nr:heavy metal-associated isoprenylated plant protein 32 [Sorghum bicolor]KXG29912.1 hypothetical protein SORBI_3004G108300 [Sorghum bicolor]|eukprot:XP_021315965.1 heavy metal-associated isoprenylated plant protein 32 [Sorghum bicolor]